ncbi:MAG: UDP-3-O-[3-hydroxymyristoyl] N-acetylglucosamine deacetylase [Candidatus Omnitrophica bacterium]|nr:UDP-3-O-[3-hydroxymyristoyl] N-acetylglucosamine deacetylase [Candidatus Omnitrophota bacterium]
METQRTINRDFSLSGKGLQTGKKVEVFFYPEEENKGIILKRKDFPKNEPLVLGSGGLKFNSSRRSIVGKGKNSVETIEHVLASLHGLGIDNARIEMTGSEPPGMDGSAKIFTEAIRKAGIKEQKEERRYLRITKPLWVEDKEAFVGIFPSDKFKVSFLIDYPVASIGRQTFSGEIEPEIFEKEIASARTFCLKEQALLLLKMGFGKGANVKNTLVMDADGPMDNELRFPDEPVRHKVLDLIGDLYLLGRPLKARVVGVRSGHRLNLKLMEKLKKEYACK